MELFAFFNFKLIEALVKSTRNALDLLKKRVGMTRFKNYIVNAIYHLFDSYLIDIFCL